jgi:hypothetical protein
MEYQTLSYALAHCRPELYITFMAMCLVCVLLLWVYVPELIREYKQTHYKAF